jgi:hypothetical protein
MSGGRRALRVTCQLTIALWIATYLAGDDPNADSLNLAEPLARVLPRPEPLASDVPEATAAPDAGTEQIAVGRDDLAAGERLLEAGGSFPALSSSYQDFESFRDYALAMRALGARFVVVQERKVVGAIDLASGELVEGFAGTKFSPRARDYTGEPGLARFARLAVERHGAGAEVMMLVPRTLDAGLFGGIARALSGRGDRHDAYREIRGRYLRGEDGGVRLRIDSAVRASGESVVLDLLFDLTQIARTGRNGEAA